MQREPFIAPLLWIVPQDLIVGIQAEALAQYLQKEAGCVTWVLMGQSLAYSFPDVLVNRGVSLDYPKQLEKTRLLRALLAGKKVEDCSATTLGVPDRKYWPIMAISPGESEARWCCRIKSRLQRWRPFAFKARAFSELTRSVRKHLRCFLENWIEDRSSVSVHGETLNLGDITVDEYTQPGNPKAYPEDGFIVTCSSYVPCTWPWIELYLIMRKERPPKHRLSLEFFNPGMPEESIEPEAEPQNIVPLQFS
jgi:hypothetical protein